MSPTLHQHKTGVVLVMFGTSVASGLAGLITIRDRFALRFRQAPVRLAFTSKVIRRIWQGRVSDTEYREEHSGVPQEIYLVGSPAEVIKGFLAEGLDSLVLQPVQIAPAVKGDSKNLYCEGLDPETWNLYRKIAVGRPALGSLGSRYPSAPDIAAVARSLSEDIVLARQNQAALVYLGHGNRLPDTDKVYNELVLEIRRHYPDIVVIMGMVEGGISKNEMLRQLQRQGVARVILKPFMIVAGNHVRKDMLGPGEETWETTLKKTGITVLPVLTGLGEIRSFADIFVQHAADAARDAGIDLG